ncbi:methionyl-tRNA formyltransferase [Candidatus Latescibacterota bacterium]
MRIVFMGTTEFGIPSLNALHEKYDVAGVVTRPDSKKGRGRKLEPSPVKTAALEMGLDVLEPVKLTNGDFLEKLKGFEADLFFVIAFRILQKEVFTIPPKGTVNLHASLLPEYRGAAPINHAIINGDKVTGLTTFFINESIDTGDIIFQEQVSIGPDETAGELAGRMSKIGRDLTLKTVEKIDNGTVIIEKQPMTAQRPAPKLFKSDGLIDWSKDVRTIHNQVRGMNPAPGAYTECSKGPLKIHRTAIVEEISHGTSGTIIESSPKEGLVVSCGTGSLRILEIQPPGKKAMDSSSFVRGYRISETGMNICEI